MSHRFVEFSEALDGNPGILKELEDYITLNCKHGAKKPVALQADNTSSVPVYFCCLKCVVNFIWRQRVDSKITSRSQK